MKHSPIPTPWAAVGGLVKYLTHGSYVTVAAVDRKFTPRGRGLIAQRIAECVNGCDNLNPDAVPELVQAVDEVLVEWDNNVLVRSDKVVMNGHAPDPNGNETGGLLLLRAALAKIKREGE